jgi:hypothetical protein
MKDIKKIILGSLLVFGLQFVLAGCVGYVGGGGYYHDGGPWYHDGPWFDGPRVGVGVDVHPPGRGWR